MKHPEPDNCTAATAQTPAGKALAARDQCRHPSFAAHLLPAILFAAHLLVGPAFAASLQLTNDPSTGGPGKFAAEEIRREAAAKGATGRVTLTVEQGAKGRRRVIASSATEANCASSARMPSARCMAG
ncbi:MAG: hypothetical protein HC841_08080, partial [Verrucomicrobiae bacterium]|nr:hypothetical protein [Verrucomicrobiae bacterium]